MKQPQYRVTRTDAEWRKLLKPDQYMVMRRFGTEPAGSCMLDQEKRIGTFVCVGCEQALFVSQTKYDSDSGWPSFYAPIKNAVGERKDPVHGELQIEVHCRQCGSHLGHLFPDGPPPTNQRYCINGITLKFLPGSHENKEA
jgi:peptide-methionine (R)-S-oxide reductase